MERSNMARGSKEDGTQLQQQWLHNEGMESSYKNWGSASSINKDQYIEKWLRTSEKIGRRMLKAGYATVKTQEMSDEEIVLNISAKTNRMKTMGGTSKEAALNKGMREKSKVNHSEVEEEEERNMLYVKKMSLKHVVNGMLNNETSEHDKWGSQESLTTTSMHTGRTPRSLMSVPAKRDQSDERKNQVDFRVVSAPGSITSEKETKVDPSQTSEESQEIESEEEEVNEEEDGQENQQVDEEKEEKLLLEYKTRLQNKDETVIFDLFEMMITKMTQVQQTMKAVKRRQNFVSRKLKTFKNKIEKHGDLLNTQVSELEEVSETSTQLIQVAMKHEENFLSMGKNVKRLQKDNVKGCFLVRGLIEVAEEDPLEVVGNFLSNQMEIEREMLITSAHRIGKGQGRPMWFKLVDADDTTTVYKHMSKLKDKVNANDQPYNISQQFTEEEREKRRRQQDIKMENRRTAVSHQLTIQASKGDLMINGEKYEKLIEPPRERDILLLDKKEAQHLDSLQMFQGGYKMVNGSAFYSYMAETRSLDRIRELFRKLKKEHLNSTHIMCGYRIFHAVAPLYQDYSDDGEWGGGRKILDALKTAGVFNVVVFVVRYHNGPNIGQARFGIIDEAVQRHYRLIPKAA